MRLPLQKAQLAQHLAHALARLVGDGDERQPQVLFEQTHQSHRRLDRAGARLDEVHVHQGQQAEVFAPRLVPAPASAASTIRDIGPGASFDATEMSPSAPSATIANVSASSPDSTRNPSGRPRRISMICARFPEASLTATTLAQSRASLSVVSAVMFAEVRPGTL